MAKFGTFFNIKGRITEGLVIFNSLTLGVKVLLLRSTLVKLLLKVEILALFVYKISKTSLET